jgi:hypothetical protein
MTRLDMHTVGIPSLPMDENAEVLCLCIAGKLHRCVREEGPVKGREREREREQCDDEKKAVGGLSRTYVETNV